jgi:DNA-binding MarR family transcriptional regulator
MRKWQFETVLKMFTELKNNSNVNTCSHDWRITYATVKKNLNELENLGFIIIEKHANKRGSKIRFTETGKRISFLMKEVNNIIVESEKNVRKKEKSRVA